MWRVMIIYALKGDGLLKKNQREGIVRQRNFLYFSILHAMFLQDISGYGFPQIILFISCELPSLHRKDGAMVSRYILPGSKFNAMFSYNGHHTKAREHSLPDYLTHSSCLSRRNQYKSERQHTRPEFVVGAKFQF